MTYDESALELPVGNYNVMYSDQIGFYLNKTDTFSLPPKVYGDPMPFVNRVINTYRQRGRSMGVLLSGLKGTGKTVDMKLICKYLAETLNMPTVAITDGFTGGAFSEFLQGIPNDSIILMDEFEKVYPETKDQNFFLSLLDGLGTSNHLFILTSNSTQLADALIHRPSRILYHKKYERLDSSIIEEIVADKCIHKHRVEEIVNSVGIIPSLTIDILMSVIDEVNLYDEHPDKFKDIFNIDFSSAGYFKITAVVDAYRVTDAEVFKTMEETLINAATGYSEVRKCINLLFSNKPLIYSQYNYIKSRLCGDATKLFDSCVGIVGTVECMSTQHTSMDVSETGVLEEVELYAQFAIQGDYLNREEVLAQKLLKVKSRKVIKGKTIFTMFDDTKIIFEEANTTRY
jgi:hypothetical protein